MILRTCSGGRSYKTPRVSFNVTRQRGRHDAPACPYPQNHPSSSLHTAFSASASIFATSVRPLTKLKEGASATTRPARPRIFTNLRAATATPRPVEVWPCLEEAGAQTQGEEEGSSSCKLVVAGKELVADVIKVWHLGTAAMEYALTRQLIQFILRFRVNDYEVYYTIMSYFQTALYLRTALHRVCSQ